MLKVPSDRPSRRSWPLPSRLRSRIEMSPRMPDGRRDSRRRTRFRRCSARPPGPRDWSCPAPSRAAAEMSTFSKKPRLLQALLAAPHLGGREGVALGQAELAADHLVQRARVARDVDALDIDARAFLDVEGHVDRQVVLVAPDVGADVDEGVAQRADGVGQRRHRLLDLVGVVPVALAHREVALQRIDIEPLEARSRPRPCRTCSARPR